MLATSDETEAEDIQPIYESLMPASSTFINALKYDYAVQLRYKRDGEKLLCMEYNVVRGINRPLAVVQFLFSILDNQTRPFHECTVDNLTEYVRNYKKRKTFPSSF